MEIVPPSGVYRVEPQNNRARQESYGYALPGLKSAGQTKDGEMLSYYEGSPFPRKGLAYFDAINLNNSVKRRTLTTFAPFAHKAMILPAAAFVLLTTWKQKISWLEMFLWNYIREAQIIYNNCDRPPYLKYKFYNNCSKAVWDLAKVFLMEIGITETAANELGWIFANLLEYDDYYKLLVEDPMTELTQQEALDNPRLFIQKFIKILSDRSPDNRDTINKYSKFANLLSFALYHPKIKRAWKKAFTQVNFKWLQLDELEYFWQMRRGNYDVKGISLETRMKDYIRILIDYWIKEYPDAGILPTDDYLVAESKLTSCEKWKTNAGVMYGISVSPELMLILNSTHAI